MRTRIADGLCGTGHMTYFHTHSANLLSHPARLRARGTFLSVTFAVLLPALYPPTPPSSLPPPLQNDQVIKADPPRQRHQPWPAERGACCLEPS